MLVWLRVLAAESGEFPSLSIISYILSFYLFNYFIWILTSAPASISCLTCGSYPRTTATNNRDKPLLSLELMLNFKTDLFGVVFPLPLVVVPLGGRVVVVVFVVSV